MFFDTHMHLEGGEGQTAAETVVSRAVAAGVTAMIAVGGSGVMNRAGVDAARRFSGHVAVALGYDREQHRVLSAGEGDLPGQTLDEVMAALRDDIRRLQGEGVSVVAVGESGLDYYYGPEHKDAQKAWFAAQLALAAELGMPVIVHSRQAEADILASIEPYAREVTGRERPPGVMHCFTGDREMAERCLAAGFFISFSGIVTFRSAEALRRVAAEIPEDRLLIETDAPYLAPEPFRGKFNEPAHLTEVARCLAGLKGMPLERLAEVTTANARRLFGWPA